MRLTARTFFMLRSFASVFRLVAIAAMAPILVSSTAAQQFPNPPMLTTAEDPNGVATADWNGDGNADLAYVTTGETPVLHLLLGNGKAPLVGKVAIDETRIGHVHTKVEGWIDQVFVDFTGKLVKKGQPMLTIYSPDMLASQRELLLAAKAKTIMQNSALPSGFDQSESLLQATRRRLELWDLSDAQIGQVLRTGEPIKNITVYSPMTGYITDRKAFPQVKVMPDTDLYTIVDLSRVWVMADVFEYEAPNIHVGETARVSLQALPGKSFSARIDYLQPEVDPMTRTLKVRLNMENPGLMLKPDMYADVEFRVNTPSKLTVPADAVLNAGERQTVFVDRGNGYFEPRQVKIGEREGDRIQILSGLTQGERIVTSGNFLIDSESQMKAAASGMGGMAGMPGMTNKPAKPETPANQPKAPGKPGAKEMGDMPGMGAEKK